MTLKIYFESQVNLISTFNRILTNRRKLSQVSSIA